MSEKIDLVTLGESLARLENPVMGPLRHARSLDLGISGAESTVAIGVRLLGNSSAWVGRVGDDEFGNLVLSTLSGQGVDVSAAVVDPQAPTALLIKERRTSHFTRVSYYRSGSAGSRLEPGDVPVDLIRSARVLHVTGITAGLSETARQALHAAVETARAAKVPVSLDLNYRRALWTAEEAAKELRTLVEQADIVFATESEARLLVDGAEATDLATALAALGPAEVMVKRGAHGAVAWCDGKPAAVDAYPVTMVDPVGAGDAFAAAYLAQRLRGSPVPERLDTAAAAGACNGIVAGDWEGLPMWEDLALMRQAGDEVER